jgi:hypothetical protein
VLIRSNNTIKNELNNSKIAVISKRSRELMLTGQLGSTSVLEMMEKGTKKYGKG